MAVGGWGHGGGGERPLLPLVRRESKTPICYMKLWGFLYEKGGDKGKEGVEEEEEGRKVSGKIINIYVFMSLYLQYGSEGGIYVCYAAN